MQDKTNKFINDYMGKPNVGNTPENTGECVGLVMVFLRSLGLPHIWGHAKDLYANAPQEYIKIPNTPAGVPIPGDVLVWNNKMGGGFGHTAIVNWANVNQVDVFEQNTNPKTPHLRTYNYNNVVGWLRPRAIPQGGGDMQAELDKLRLERDRNWDLYQDALKEADKNRKERDDHWNKLQEALKKQEELKLRVVELEKLPNQEAEKTLKEARDVLNKILK